MTNPLAALVAATSSTTAAGFKVKSAAVASTMPLTVIIDGYTDPVGPSDTLISGLQVGQRVCCLLADRRLIILGKYGG